MSEDIAGIAFIRAWGVYLLIYPSTDKNDARRALLERFIRQRCRSGLEDPELLAVEGLRYLKRLDEAGSAALD